MLEELSSVVKPQSEVCCFPSLLFGVLSVEWFEEGVNAEDSPLLFVQIVYVLNLLFSKDLKSCACT